jgi:hypothetical protein
MVKVKLFRYCHEGTKRERKYSFDSFLTSASDGCHDPAVFDHRERTPVPTGQEAGWASELVWTHSLKEKYFSSAWDRTPDVQSVVSTILTELW